MCRGGDIVVYVCVRNEQDVDDWCEIINGYNSAMSRGGDIVVYVFVRNEQDVDDWYEIIEWLQ